ncbi:TRAP transporter small permease [Pollutimonas harenae]|nr:TRAP transporter small permease [Pollutimonas harenae]
MDKVIYLASVVIALGSLLAMFVALLLEVVVRYATNSGLGWPTELPSLLFPWLVMSGVVLAAQRGQHIAVTAILHILGKTSMRILLIALQLMLIVVFLYLAEVGLRVIEVTGTEVFPVTRITAKWAYLSLIAGFVGVALTALSTIVQLVVAPDPAAVRAHKAEEDI